MNNNQEKEKKEKKKNSRLLLVIGLVVVLLLVVVSIYLLNKETKEKVLSSLEHLNEYQVVIEVTKKDDTLVQGKYQYDDDKNIIYFQLFNDEAVLEDQYYDVNNKKLYYKNSGNSFYKIMDYETNYRFENVLNSLVKEAKEGPLFESSNYTLSKDKWNELVFRDENLLNSFITNTTTLDAQDIKFTFTRNKEDLDTLKITISTEEEPIEVKAYFVKVDTNLTLPELVSMENRKESLEEVDAKWIVLYLQQIFAEMPQTLTPVTDVNILWNSSYKEELQKKLSSLPIDLRLRITPSSAKESSLISGTITFENGKTVTLENNLIKNS